MHSKVFRILGILSFFTISLLVFLVGSLTQFRGFPAGIHNGRLLIYYEEPCDLLGSCGQHKVYFGNLNEVACKNLGGNYVGFRGMGGSLGPKVCVEGEPDLSDQPVIPRLIELDDFGK